jgi:transcription elongation factor GreA
VDVEKLSGSKVVFGATVTMIDGDTDAERKLTIVGEDESDVDRGLISFQTPIARALIGKEEGDVAEVKLPAGVKEYEIVAVEFVAPDVRIGSRKLSE